MPFEFTEEHWKKIETIYHDVGDIKLVLKGYNGREGLVRQVANNTKTINKLWIAIAFIVASVGGGVYGVFQLLIGG